jgi:hypothetical protein
MLPYAPLPHHEGAKRDTIRVIKRVNANPPHHRGFMLTYLMETETPLVCHIVKWQGCSYTNQGQ